MYLEGAKWKVDISGRLKQTLVSLGLDHVQRFMERLSTLASGAAFQKRRVHLALDELEMSPVRDALMPLHEDRTSFVDALLTCRLSLASQKAAWWHDLLHSPHLGSSTYLLVYTFDVDKVSLTQRLKAWDVVDKGNGPHLQATIQQVKEYVMRHGERYVRCCLEQQFEVIGEGDRRRRLQVPMRWKLVEEVYRDANKANAAGTLRSGPWCRLKACVTLGLTRANLSLPVFEAENGGDSDMVLKTYELTPEAANLLVELGAEQVQMALKLSPEEQEISRCPRSLMILGRSGTGKTTGQ